jgi:hypothetical protein
MVVPISRRPLKGELILGIKLATAGFVTAQECVFTRADNELISRIITITGKNYSLHGCQNIPFIRSRAG